MDEDISKYDGEWALKAPREGGFEEDRGLVVKSPGKHHAIAAKLDKPFDFTGDSREMFVVQYEVNFQNGMTCGGAYMKLLTQSDDLDLAKFNDKTPYTIMFGPDRCGQDSKLHFIFRHKNPITGEFEEKHAKKTADFKFFDDKKTHLFTLSKSFRSNPSVRISCTGSVTHLTSTEKSQSCRCGLGARD